MEGLFHIKEENIQQFMEITGTIDKEAIMDSISVAVTSVPSMSKIISKYITRVLEKFPELKDSVKILFNDANTSQIALASKHIYGRYLGAQTTFFVDEPISNILEFLKLDFEMPQKFITQAEDFAKKTGIGFENAFLNVLYCHSIIQKFDFYRAECRFRLKEYSYETIIESMLIEETLSDISMAVDLCKYEGFLKTLSKNITRFSRRKEIVAFIFVAYYKPPQVGFNDNQHVVLGNQEDIDILVSMFDEETEKYALRIGSASQLNLLLARNYKEPSLPVIRFNDFQNMCFSDKNQFFTAFLKLSSQTPTHFLSYLEYYKKDFILNEQQQSDFVTLLKDFNKDNEPFLEIVLPKLAKFNIINESLI